MKAARGRPKPPRNARKCPICGKPAESAYRPFCSKRCQQVDLSRWLAGSYVIPGRDEDDPAKANGEDGSA